MTDNALTSRKQSGFLADQWERFIAPARGFASVAQKAAASIPQSFNRLLTYQPGTEDPDAPIDAMNLAGLATFAPVGAVPRGAITAGRRGTLNAYADNPHSSATVFRRGNREQMTRFNEMGMAGHSAAEIGRASCRERVFVGV